MRSVRDRTSAIVMQPMVTNGVETLIGVTADPLFGPLVAFGLGGVQVEVLARCGVPDCAAHRQGRG